MATNIINIILVSLLLVGMVMLLAGIRSMFGESHAAAEKLSREVKEDENVISSNSIFSEFLSHPEKDEVEISELSAEPVSVVEDQQAFARLSRE